VTAAPQGMIQMRLMGQTAQIMAIYEIARAAIRTMPVGPRGGALYTCSIKENRDCVTSRFYLELPPDLFARVLGGANVPPTQAAAHGLPFISPAEGVYDAEIVEPPTALDQRFKVAWRP
jgi:hypothetical protein